MECKVVLIFAPDAKLYSGSINNQVMTPYHTRRTRPIADSTNRTLLKKHAIHLRQDHVTRGTTGPESFLPKTLLKETLRTHMAQKKSPSPRPRIKTGLWCINSSQTKLHSQPDLPSCATRHPRYYLIKPQHARGG